MTGLAREVPAQHHELQCRREVLAEVYTKQVNAFIYGITLDRRETQLFNEFAA